MSIESERRELIRRIRKDGRRNYKELAKRMRFPYTTLMLLLKDGSGGTIRSWVKIERYFQRADSLKEAEDGSRRE
jgi:hypothetical protein